MKKLLLLGILILSISTFGQTKLDGIGIFRLGMNEDTFLSKIDSLGYKGKECDDVLSLECRPSGMNYTKIKSKAENVVTYILGNYEVAGENIEKLTLRFYNKDLFELSISDGYISDLIDKLELKYGEFDLDKKEGTTTCYFNGKSYKLPKVTYTKKYSNGDIKMNYSLIFTRNSKCDKTSYQFLGLYFKSIWNLVQDLERKEKEKESAKEREEEVKKLEDL